MCDPAKSAAMATELGFGIEPSARSADRKCHSLQATLRGIDSWYEVCTSFRKLYLRAHLYAVYKTISEACCLQDHLGSTLVHTSREFDLSHGRQVGSITRDALLDEAGRYLLVPKSLLHRHTGLPCQKRPSS